MPKIPDPEALVEKARSINRKVEDREWKKYQRYIAKHEQKYGTPPTKHPISFEKYCAWLKFFEEELQIPQ